MSENPYQPPAAASPEMDPRVRSVAELVRLRGIAAADRRILFSIAGQLVVVAAAMRLVPLDLNILELLYLLVVLASLCFTVQLAIRLQGIAVALVLGLLSTLGLLGLIVTLLVHLWAFAVLRRAGFPAGLLGIDPRKIQRVIDAMETPVA